MRSVWYSSQVEEKLLDWELYLKRELKLSPTAAHRRMERMNELFNSLALHADYAPCRFEKWREKGWRCVVFEKGWIFAYQLFEDGIILMDMANARSLWK